jgi:beta-glucanase (GH16 family)
MNGRFFLKLVSIAAVLVGGFSTPTGAADSVWTQVWSDECNGASGKAVDASKWNMVNSGGGFGNAELQYYTNRTANSYYDGKGNLVIKTIKEAYNGSKYTSAKLYTQNKGDWTYCRMDIRAKLPKGRGLWPAFWMMPTASKYGGWPTGGEIDIMEERGDEPSKITSTLHYGNPHDMTSFAGYLLRDQTFDTAYHIFRMEWSVGLFNFYIDTTIVCRIPNTLWFTSAVSKTANPNAPFDQSFFLQINTAVGGPGSGYTGNTNPDDAVFPQYMTIDYVRVFKKTAAPKTTVNQERQDRPALDLLFNAAGRSGPACRLSFEKRPVAGTLSIFSLRGERVRTFDISSIVNNQIVWDGKDGHGRYVGRGTFLVAAEGAGFHATGRIVVDR